jgi:hypothetical protein
MSPQILSLIVFAENIHLNLNQPTEIVVCAPAFRLWNSLDNELTQLPLPINEQAVQLDI